MLKRLRPILSHVGVGTLAASAPLLMGATGTFSLPENLQWLPYVLSALAPAATGATVVLRRLAAARKRARADFLDAQAAAELADKDGSNDLDAAGKRLQAALLRADAAVLDVPLPKDQPKP